MTSRISKIWYILGGLAAVAVALAATAFFARDRIREQVNGYRAERLLTQARTEFSQSNWVVAARKALAAHYLAPENSEIKLLIARSLLKERQPSAVQWWKQVLDQPELPVEDLRTLTAILINSNQLDDAMLFLYRLLELDSGNPETQQLWVRALDSQRRFTYSLNLAQNLVQRGTDSWEIHKHYITMLGILQGEKGQAQAVEHLTGLIGSGGPLALPAARELAAYKAATSTQRLAAAGFLREHGENALDRLYALSLEFKEGQAAAAEVEATVKAILDERQSANIGQLAKWAVWIGWADWYIKAVDYDMFVAAGNEPDIYLRTMVEAGAFQDILSLAQRLGPEQGGNSPVFLFYRALASDRLGDTAQAEQILDLATQVVDPERSAAFERYMLDDNRWDLLLKLYRLQARDAPEDPRVAQKLVSALYYTGAQDALADYLHNMDFSAYSENPAFLAFALYLKLLLEPGQAASIHGMLESELAKFPEIFDTRLVLGVSYLMQGNPALAVSFAEKMPQLSLEAPRYLRVCAAVLGGDAGSLLTPLEMQTLLPRERFLLSRAAQPASR